jgi:hypothetical protein
MSLSVSLDECQQLVPLAVIRRDDSPYQTVVVREGAEHAQRQVLKTVTIGRQVPEAVRTSGLVVWALAMIVFALCPTPTIAQSTTSVNGVVRDTTGGVVVGATVTATQESTGGRRSTVTNDRGYFEIVQLAPGRYELRIEAQGFRETVLPGTVLSVGRAVPLEVRLDVGEVSQTVSVTAGLTNLNRADASVGSAITREEVAALPALARNAVGVLTLQPGVVFTGQSDLDQLGLGSIRQLDLREGVVNGVQGNQLNVTVDGVDANDFLSQAAFASAVPLTLDSVQEFRVTTAGADSTVGASGGAQVALVTRSGANRFFGGGRWYGRSDDLAANAFFNKRAGLERPEINRDVFGGSVGGPLKRNRAFFFADVERRSDRSETSVLRTVPTDSYRQGTLRYRSRSGSVVTLGPDALRTADPLGRGVSQDVLSLLQLYPQGNDSGAGDGLNSMGFRFNSPVKTSGVTGVLRLDAALSADGRHQLFGRASANDIQLDLEPATFPGQPATSRLLNRNRAVVVGYTGQFGTSVVVSSRVGRTESRLEQAGINQPYYAVGFSPLFTTAPSETSAVPVWNATQDLTWHRGNHRVQVGTSTRWTRAHRSASTQAYPRFEANSPINQLPDDGDSTNDPTDPNDFSTRYGTLLGSIQLVTGPLALLDPSTGQYQAAGTPLDRRWAENTFEVYGQHVWQWRPTLTLTAGLRYTYATPLWETRGLQIRPEGNVLAWWEERLDNAAKGIPGDAQADLRFTPAGPANDAPSFWRPDRNNFAPRLSLTWSPGSDHSVVRALFGSPGKSVVRVGGGLHYHRIGGPISFMEDAVGNGLSSNLLRNPDTLTLTTAPRFTGTCALTSGCGGFPDLAAMGVVLPPGLDLPAAPGRQTFRSTFAVDEALRTPYTADIVVSLQREIARHTVLDVAYVGTRGRDLLIRQNFGQYLGTFTDPQSGQNLWAAMQQVTSLMGDLFVPRIDPRSAAAVGAVGPIPFAENLLPNLPGHLAQRFNDPFYATLTPSQAFYAYLARSSDMVGAIRSGFDNPPTGISPWSTSVDPEGNGRVLWQSQFSNLATIWNGGRSRYDSLQLSLRRTFGESSGGINYALSSARDNGSLAENADVIAFDSLAFSHQIPNPFDATGWDAPADFDIRHNINMHWVWALPIGSGRRLGGQLRGWADALAGGWQLSGIWRWRSGFPLSLATINRGNTDLTAVAPLLGPVDSDVQRTGSGGLPNLFADPATVARLAQFSAPGMFGSRNALRGPAYSVVDLAFAKRIRVPVAGHTHDLQVQVIAFNAFNQVNFSTAGIDLAPRSVSLGRITNTAGPRGGAREVELAVRYTF